MHSAEELRSPSFRIALDGREVALTELFDGFGEHDRLGVVVRRRFGAVGASALITATVTAFYDIQRSRGPPRPPSWTRSPRSCDAPATATPARTAAARWPSSTS